MAKENTPQALTLAKRIVTESPPKRLKLLDWNEITELLINVLKKICENGTSVLSHIFKALKER